jgi:hypothetical protein
MKNTPVGAPDDFLEVVSILEKNLRYVEQLGMDSTTIHVYKRILSHLRGRSEAEILKIIGSSTAPTKSKKSSPPELAMSNEQISALQRNEIADLLNKKDLSRQFLERIAKLRFGVTTGALSSLRSMDALRDKIRNMLENEGTHDAIARVAAASPETGDQHSS